MSRNNADNPQASKPGQNSFMRIYLDEIENHASKGFGNAKRIAEKYSHLRWVELGIAIVSIIAVTLAIFDYFYEFGDSESTAYADMTTEEKQAYQQRKKTARVLLYILFGVSLGLAFLTIYRYILNMQYQKLRGKIRPSLNLFTSGQIYPLAIEVFFVMLIPYPWLEGQNYTTTTLYGDITIKYHVNAIVQFFSALRIIVVIRSILALTYWGGGRAQRICDFYGGNPSFFFTLRCLMRANPAKFIFYAYLLCLPYFAYMLMIAEGPTLNIDGDTMKFTFLNSLWNVIITAATIGYGDYYARTLLGRSIVFIVSLWGTTIISLMVVAVTNLFLMTEGQEKSFWLLKRFKVRAQIEKAAAKALVTFYRGRYEALRGSEIDQINIEKYKTAIAEFKQLKREYKDIADIATQEDEMRIKLEDLQDRIKALEERNKALLETNALLMKAHDIDVTWQSEAIETLSKPKRRQHRRQWSVDKA